MFLTCPSVCRSVTAPNLWTRYFENDWTDFDASWHKCSTGQWMRRSTLWVRTEEVKGQDRTRLKIDLEMPLDWVGFLVFNLSMQQCCCKAVTYCGVSRSIFACCQAAVALVFFLRQPQGSCLIQYQLYKLIPVMFFPFFRLFFKRWSVLHYFLAWFK